MKKLVTSIAIVASLLFTAASAFAGEATDVVKANQAKLFELISQPKSATRQTKLRKLFDASIAYDVMSKGSLGKKWGSLDADQQKKFSGLLTELIRSNYKKNLKMLLKFSISYEPEESKGDDVVVNSLAKHKTDAREPPFELDFRMAKMGGKWMITDIITEEASMVRTYRAQFLRILKKDGFDKLIEKMQTKLDKLNSEHGE